MNDGETRECRRCKVTKNISEFHRYSNPKYSHLIKRVCKLCVKDINKIYNSDTEKRRNDVLKSRYGITLEQFNNTFEEQGHQCAICGRREPSGKTGWMADHSHTTNKFRGVLCHKCNTVLGMAEDKIAVLRNAADYLERNILDMKIRISILEENGETMWEYSGPINLPKDMRTPPDRPMRDNEHSCLVYGFTFQPITKPILKETK